MKKLVKEVRNQTALARWQDMFPGAVDGLTGIQPTHLLLFHHFDQVLEIAQAGEILDGFLAVSTVLQS